jgi:hypothetical protein
VRLSLALVLVVAATGLPTTPAAAQAVRVIVDAAPIIFDQPPVTIGGRVLIPLRGVFERLGAFVQWNPANSTVLATRGGTEIQLTVGSRTAFVNGRQVVLDVPAMVVRGRTLVPLRFVSEAIGARADWDPATSTVFVTSASGARPPFPQPPVVRAPQPPAAQPPLPPVPSQSVIQGTVVRVDAANSRLYVQRGDQIYTVIITTDTAITGTAGAISLTQLRPGDLVTVTVDAQNRAIVVRAQTVGAPAAQVRITSIAHTARRPLRSGDTLTVTMEGTPGGQATFDIFGVAQGIPMTEISPGVYRGTYTVRANDNVLSGAVFGHLRVGGQDAVVAQAEALVSIDARAPTIEGRIPQPNSTINNQRPNILVLFDDHGGSGVNPSNSALIVNGQNVTAAALWSETAVSYTPQQSFPQGTITVQTVLRDRAGNQTADTFAFTIGVVQGSLIRAVTVNPPTTVQPGQVFTVMAVGEPGGQATFSVEGVVSNVPMAETQPGVYVGQFTAGTQTAQNARVLVTLVRGGQTATVAASSRVSFTGTAFGAQPSILSPTAGAAHPQRAADDHSPHGGCAGARVCGDDDRGHPGIEHAEGVAERGRRASVHAREGERARGKAARASPLGLMLYDDYP